MAIAPIVGVFISERFDWRANFIFIMVLSIITFLVYISNLSVIFINHLAMKLEVYSFVQASVMTSFVVFSLSSIKLIAKKGVEFTKNIGSILLLLGTLVLFITSLIDHIAVIFICVFISILATGGSFMAGTFGNAGIRGLFPQINGVAMAAYTSMRLFLISLFVYLTEVFFNGTIIPVAVIIFTYVVCAVGLYILLLIKEKRLKYL